MELASRAQNAHDRRADKRMGMTRGSSEDDAQSNATGARLRWV